MIAHRLFVAGALAAGTWSGFAGATTPAAPASAFAGQLARMPAAVFDVAADADTPTLTYVDMELVWERLGVGADPAERLAALGRTAEATTWSQPPVLFQESALDVDGARAEVGFSMLEIGRELAVLAPPNRTVVADVAVSGAAIEQAVTTDPLWSPDLRVVPTADGDYYAWGDEDFAIDPARRSPLRPLGQGGQLAVLGELSEPVTVVRTLAVADMEAALATAAGHAPSAADAGPFAAADEALAGVTVVQAIGVTATAPYLGLLVVEVADDAGPRAEVLLLHATADEAAANAPMVADALPDAAVTVDGTVVAARVDGVEAYRTLVQMLMRRELLPAVTG